MNWVLTIFLASLGIASLVYAVPRAASDGFDAGHYGIGVFVGTACVLSALAIYRAKLR
jgi:hypothetical protein